MVRSVSNFMSINPLPHLLWCKGGYFIRSNALLSIMIVDKLFGKSTNDSFGQSIACWEGKYSVGIYFNKNTMLPLL